MVEMYGDRKWAAISRHLPGRIGKQCRERWTNHLRPEIDKVRMHIFFPLSSFNLTCSWILMRAKLEVICVASLFGERWICLCSIRHMVLEGNSLRLIPAYKSC